MPLLKAKEVFTYGMYKTWSGEERWELIEGILYDMSPASNRLDLLQKILDFILIKCII